MASQSVEDYLKAIFKLHEKGEASTGRIAEELGVAAASVTNMCKRLSTMDLAVYNSHKGIELTEAGRSKALQIIRRHRLLETFLITVMGYTWDEVHAEAENLEHHISQKFEDRMDKMLGFPEYDPHGDPIPSHQGEIPETTDNTLSQTQIGNSVVIRRVDNTNPELLRHLKQRGLEPGAKITVNGKDPFDGPITIDVENETQIVGNEVARKIFVDTQS